ncbi:MAG: SpoIIE family protein phosphatase [Myxococcales bacterium]|nr:SpoIIE family protein phosphatase [Myxococcales bacterium]
MSMVLASGLSHVGRVRDHNEDSFFVDTESQVFLVADGMGGHAAGEVASKMAVDGVSAKWRSAPLQEQVREYAGHGDIDRRKKLLATLREGVLAAHKGIVELGCSDESKKGMGTTLTGFLIAGGEALFAHAGDSRAYLVRDRIPLLLSEDHTISSRLRAAGIDRGIDGPEPERWKGGLTNALGMADDTRVTTFAVPLFSGDRLVLCSDGVHDYLSEVEVGQSVLSAVSPALAAKSLVEMALDRGGADNATCIVVKVMEAGTTKLPKEQRDAHETAIAQCPLFAGLTPQQVLRALRITTPRSYSQGKDVPRVALEDRVAYAVLEGEVAGSGVRACAGDVLLPEALLQQTVVSELELTARLDSHLLMIRRNDFIELCDDDPDLGVVLYETMARLVSR